MARKPATRKDGIVAVSYLVVIALILTVIFYLGHLNIPADRTVRFVMIFGLFTLIGGLFLAIPNCWYANVLSIMNLCCGLTGIFLMYNFRSADMLYLHEAVFCLIFLGQFFDLFDGRAAEHWGSTPKGELFDDGQYHHPPLTQSLTVRASGSLLASSSLSPLTTRVLGSWPALCTP